MRDVDRTQAQLNESAPEIGAYIADDLAGFTVVTKCVANPSDTDHRVGLRFPMTTTQYPSTPYDSFASVVATVMIDGTISVAGEVADYERDSNGNWIIG